MVTKPNFLITMVIGVAVGAFIFAFSAPNEASGFHSSTSARSPASSVSNDVKLGTVKAGGASGAQADTSKTTPNPGGGSTITETKWTQDKNNVLDSGGEEVTRVRVYDAKGQLKSCTGSPCPKAGN